MEYLTTARPTISQNGRLKALISHAIRMPCTKRCHLAAARTDRRGFVAAPAGQTSRSRAGPLRLSGKPF